MRGMKRAVPRPADLASDLVRSENARWGHNTLRGLLLLGVIYVRPLQQIGFGAREHALSIIGFLPESVLFDERVFVCFKTLFIAFATLWFFDLLVPQSAWIATVSLTVVLSLFLESRSYTLHQYQVLAMLLWVFCFWYQTWAVPRSPARAELARRAPTRMPRWVYALCLYYLCLTYSFSGMTKLLSSGIRWANGTSLQLWVLLWGDPSASFAQLLLGDRRLAEAAQAATLFFESTAVLALFFPHWRRVTGIGLLGFHLTSETIFHLRFYPNIFALAAILVLYPAWTIPRDARSGASRDHRACFAR
jgi:hypothetical protein